MRPVEVTTPQLTQAPTQAHRAVTIALQQPLRATHQPVQKQDLQMVRGARFVTRLFLNNRL